MLQRQLMVRERLFDTATRAQQDGKGAVKYLHGRFRFEC
jgi:hypothetical protein